VDLESVYKKNMEFLKDYDPVLYDRLDKCNLENIKLIITEGMYNIKYKENIIYPKNVDEVISNQIEQFYRQPQLFYNNPTGMKVEGYAKFTTKSIHKILKHSPLIVANNYWKDNYIKNMYLETHKKMKTIPFLLLFGIGNGEYIKKIINEKRILHLMIIDNNYEFLKVSMHLIDWVEIFKIAEIKNISIKIIIGPYKLISSEISDYIYTRPMYLSYIQFLTHINTPDFEKVRSFLSKELQMLKLGWGFYEDEKVSLNNTLMNLKKTSYIFEGSKKTNNSIIVVGAGPSLDNDIKMLKQVSSKVIIISCGTALRTLWKHNIKPDFHVEIERLKGTYKALLHIDKEFLKQITLVGLSVLHPKVKTLFKNFMIYFRSNDAGSSCVRSYRKYNFVNPTCVNAGLDLALSLNPSKIYLLGVDCGFRDPSLHHAEDNINSIKESKKYKKSVKYMENKVYPGNFKGEFYSSDILIWSKNSIEQAISSYSSKTVVYNCSDGVRINIAKPRVFNSHDFLSVENKIDVLDTFTKYSKNELYQELEENLVIAESNLNSLLNEYKAKFYKNKIKSIDESLVFLDSSYILILDKINKNGIVSSLVSGSIKLIYSVIYAHLLASKSLEDIEIDFFNRSIKEVIIFLEKISSEFIRIKNNTLDIKKEIR